MNIKFLILGIVVIVLLVAFGKNPVQEAQERRAKGLEGKDPLVNSIQEHNQKSQFGGGGMGMGMGMGTQTPEGAIREPQPGYPGAAPQPVPAPQNNYYPPPPENSGYGGQPARPNMGPGTHNRPLVNGKDFALMGSQVYALDASGNRTVMPDGDYPVFSGRIKMMVRNGQKQGLTN